MKFLYDLFPLLLFFAAFKFYDIYVATAVAIAASFRPAPASSRKIWKKTIPAVRGASCT